MTEVLAAGEWLQKRREACGLTRKALAELVACSPDTIKKIEGEIRRPSLQIAHLLAEHLHIPAAHHDPFIRFVRGQFVPHLLAPHELLPQAAARPDRYKVLVRLEALPEQKLFGIEAARQRVVEVVGRAERPFLSPKTQAAAWLARRPFYPAAKSSLRAKRHAAAHPNSRKFSHRQSE